MSLTPEQLANRTHVMCATGWWGLVMAELIKQRAFLNRLASEERGCGDEHRDCYRRAARALGPVISYAESEKRKLDDVLAALERELWPPREAISDEELLRLGREVCEDPTHKAQMRQGRPLTNIEMVAVIHWLDEDPPLRFARELVAWLDSIEEETALAAVTARLNVSPIASEVCDV